MRTSVTVGRRFEATLLAAATAAGIALLPGTARAQPAPLPAEEAPEVMIVVEGPEAAPPAGAAAAPTSAAAADRPAANLRPKRTREEWYGYQTLIVDTVSTAMLFGPALLSRKPEESIMVAGGIGFVVGGPVVHFLHGNVGPGFGAFALRVGMPLTCAFWGMLGGAVLMPRSSQHGAENGAAVGFFAGMAGAAVLDAGLLAYEKVKDDGPYDRDSAKAAPPKHAPAPKAVGLVGILPQATVLPGGGSVGVTGVFF